MNKPVDIEAVRAEALRKLGRNVVNFSKIEAMLKHLLTVGQLDHIEKEVSDHLHKNQIRLQKQTLGKLVQEFSKNILSSTNPPEPETDFSGKGISLSLKITYSNPDFVKIQRRNLSKIVAERNKLIHKDLALLDTSSVEDYQKLISLLDEQNPRLLNHLEELGRINKVLAESLETFREFVRSTDWPSNSHFDQSNT
jgi:hypothetical protein